MTILKRLDYSRAMATKRISRASRALAAIMAEGGDAATRLGRVIHRVQLASYTSGRRRPDVDTANRIEALTDGQVPIGDWAIDPDGNPVLSWADDEDDGEPA